MDHQTTIVGRPTYVAMFSGVQDAGPILDKLHSIGYPHDDISILLRPPGSDAVRDLVNDENAAGQAADVQALLEKHKDRLQDACTIVLLHPDTTQVDAVRAALTGMGGEEFEYVPESRYTGHDSEADFVRATVGSLSEADNAGIEGTATHNTAGTTGTKETPEPGHFTPSPARATTDAPAPAGQTAGPVATTTGPGAESGPSTAATGSAAPAAEPTPSATPAADQTTSAAAALPDTSDLKKEIQTLHDEVEQVKKELEQRD